MVVLLPGSGGLRTNGREVPPSGLKTKQPDLYYPKSLTRGHSPHPPRPLPPSQSPGGEGGQAAWRVGEAGFAAQPASAHGELPGPLLTSCEIHYLCAFASLRSFLPVARSLREIYYPKSLTRGHPPHPPRPLPPSQSPGGEGGPSGLEVFRRLGAAGFSAQPNIANVG